MSGCSKLRIAKIYRTFDLLLYYQGVVIMVIAVWLCGVNNIMKVMRMRIENRLILMCGYRIAAASNESET